MSRPPSPPCCISQEQTQPVRPGVSSMQELGKGRGDHGHEKLQPWSNKSTEPPFRRPLRCSRLRVLVVVPSSRVRPSSIVTLSPSRGWWPAGQLESSSHRPQNWRASWERKRPKRGSKLSPSHPSGTQLAKNTAEEKATPLWLLSQWDPTPRGGLEGRWGSQFGVCLLSLCNLGFASCPVLLWLTRGSPQVWLRKVRGFPGVCLSLPLKKQNCTLIPGIVIAIACGV